MSNRKTKYKRGLIHNNTIARPTIKCPNCGGLSRGGHFIPPIFSSEGYYICTPKRYKHN